MYHLISLRENVTRGLVVFGKVIGVPLLAYLVLIGYQAWQAAQHGPVQESATLTTPTDTPVSPTGTLFFSAVVPSNEPRYPNVFRYRFTDARIEQLFPYPAFSYNHISAAYAGVLGPFADTEDPDDVQPLWYSPEREELGPMPGVNQYNEHELVTSPDNIHYAYSYQEAPDANPFDIFDWNIALHNFETGTVVTIPVAAEPHFLNDGTDLAFMRPDGLYRYNLASDEIYRLYGAYEDLTMIDDYAISSDGTTLIFTAPSIHTVSIAAFQDDTQLFQESSVHFDTNFRYRHPVISPDGRLYAVTAIEDRSFDEAIGQYTSGAIEIRQVENRELVDTVPVQEFPPSAVQLDTWLTE